MTRLFLLALVILSIGCRSPEAEEDATPSNMIPLEVPRLDIRFAYPDSFLAGRFAAESLPPAAREAGMESPFVNAAVLVAPAVLGDGSLDAIPVGDVPVIWLDRSPTSERVSQLMPADSVYEVSGNQVRQFPGFPGPYGDQVFYFTVHFGPGDVLELGAHKRFFGGADESETHYDEVIKAVIPTLESLR